MSEATRQHLRRTLSLAEEMLLAHLEPIDIVQRQGIRAPTKAQRIGDCPHPDVIEDGLAGVVHVDAPLAPYHVESLELRGEGLPEHRHHVFGMTDSELVEVFQMERFHPRGDPTERVDRVEDLTESVLGSIGLTRAGLLAEATI